MTAERGGSRRKENGAEEKRMEYQTAFVKVKTLSTNETDCVMWFWA